MTPVATLPAIRHSAAPADRALVSLQAEIYKQSRHHRPLSGIMKWLLDRRNLDAAWLRVRSANGSATPGVDGAVCAQFDQRLGDWLAELADELSQGRYQPSPPRWIEIPKPERPDAFRRLGILTIHDRIVHTAIKQVLEPILDPLFLPTSFAYRPGRSVAGALHEAMRLADPHHEHRIALPWAVHLDVANCFDTIEHNRLLTELSAGVADEDLFKLLRQLLAIGSRATGLWPWRRNVGLIQGSALSPLLCNFYLHPVDAAIRDAALANHAVTCLRYADDLLLLASNRRSCRTAIALVRRQLARRGLRLRTASAKPQPLHVGVDWLGVRIRARNDQEPSARSVGYLVPASRISAMIDRLAEITAPPCHYIDRSAFNLGRWIVSLNQQLREWHAAYQFADNGRELFAILDEHARSGVLQLLQAVQGLRAGDAVRRFRRRLPRGFWTWEVDGTRLVVLSSLAPRSPSHLTRRPAWMRS